MIELTLTGVEDAAYDRPPRFSGPPGFSGSLDLLLAIVRRNRYPLDRLPLGEITRQFSAYVQQAPEQKQKQEQKQEQKTAQNTGQNLELGAEFFETISWLVLLKSRALLPESAKGTEAAPAEELRQALVAHAQIAPQQMKEWSGWLGERLDRAGLEAGQQVASAQDPEQGTVPALETDTLHPSNVPAPPVPVPTVHDALVSARRALAAARLYADAQAAEEAGVSTEEVLAALRSRLAALAPGQTLSTAAWFYSHAPEIQGTLLLALLELARLGALWVYQPAPSAPLWVQRPPQSQDTPLPMQESKHAKRARRPKPAIPHVRAGAAR